MSKCLSESQYKILTDACVCPAGAAKYLQVSKVEQLLALGLLEARNEHSVRATDRGREVWQAGGAL